MSRGEQESGLSGLICGTRWQTAAWRALAVFILGYVLPRALLPPASGLAGFLQLLATALTFVLTTGAVYQLLQSRAAKEWVEKDDGDVATVILPVAAHSESKPAATAHASTVAAVPQASMPSLSIETLGQVALERLCMALYQFNGLHSQTVAIGVEGEYRIRLVPRNAEKAIAILQCRAGAQEQGVQAYLALLRVMEEEDLDKAFFVAPAGFAPAVVAEARSRHVTLVDLKLLQAMIERLPDAARAVMLDVAA
jgi:restriction system protein